MASIFTNLCVVGLLALSTGCAGSYTLVKPDRIGSYTQSPSSGPVEFAYQFDALRLRGGNKKYVKKEAKRGYRVVAVRLTNKSTQEINFSRDLTLLYGDRPVTPISGTVAASDMKQGVAIYLLYLLANTSVGGQFNPQTGTTTGATFLPTGLFIAGGNMLGASGANTNMRKEFEYYDLTNRTIKPGETRYGILSLREAAVAPLKVEMRANAAATAPAAQPTPAPALAQPATGN